MAKWGVLEPTSAQVAETMERLVPRERVAAKFRRDRYARELEGSGDPVKIVVASLMRTGHIWCVSGDVWAGTDERVWKFGWQCAEYLARPEPVQIGSYQARVDDRVQDVRPQVTTIAPALGYELVAAAVWSINEGEFMSLDHILGTYTSSMLVVSGHRAMIRFVVSAAPAEPGQSGITEPGQSGITEPGQSGITEPGQSGIDFALVAHGARGDNPQAWTGPTWKIVVGPGRAHRRGPLGIVSIRTVKYTPWEDD